MGTSKNPDGCKNWAGGCIAKHRKKKGMSQNDLAIKLQSFGIDVDKNAIQMLEHGHRYVRDMELYMIATILDVSLEELFRDIPEDIAEELQAPVPLTCTRSND